MASKARRELALKLLVVLARAYNAVAEHGRAHAAKRGLTPGEFGVLEVLYHKGEMLLGEVQRKVLVTSGGVTYLVDRLAEKGLVERRACPEDRRARYAALTPAGDKLMQEIFPEHADWIEHALRGLAQPEQEQAVELLRTLGKYAEATAPGGAAKAMPKGT